MYNDVILPGGGAPVKKKRKKEKESRWMGRGVPS